MKALIDRIEPGVWVLFGGGFMVGSLLLPAWILVVGVAWPLGWVPADALDYERAYALGSHWIGRLVLLALVVLPLWNAANHLRHFLIDLGGYERDGVVAPLLYGAAALVTVGALVAVIRL